MKYLAAFVIGVGLMANGPAFAANSLKFRDFHETLATDVSKCLAAQDIGIELKRETKTNLASGTQFFERRVFLSRQNDEYIMNYLTVRLDKYGDWSIVCHEATRNI